MKRSKQLAVSTLFCLVPTLLTTTSLFGDDHHVRRVLVISLDGAHSLDLALWVKNNPNSALAQLSRRGIDFTNASTTKPSDSIPSTVGIFTGASPALGGMYYDDAYNRAWFPPGSHCTGAPGTVIDLKQGYNLGLDGLSGLDPAKLPQRIVNGVCVPVFPHDMIRVNTVFEVVRSRGRTAYSEKRPSYDFLNGPSGKGVQDLYTPEIACYPFTPPATCNNALLKQADTQAFDELRVKSVLNEIDGKDHTGASFVGTPILFGMNFQSVNAAKKDSTILEVGTGLPGGGYADDLGTPNADLANALGYIDGAIGRMVSELAAQNLTDTTAIIIMAKHGETSLDPSKRFVESTSAIQTQLNLAFSPASPPAIVKLTEKSTAFIWLKDQSQTLSVVNVLTKKSVETTLNIAQTLSGESLKLLFPDPLLDPAPPDIVVVPNPGTTYEPATNPVLAEHGGFNENDTHVPLLVVVPTLPPSVNRAAVTTTQIAPTILNLLGIDTRQLQAVQIEGTRVLPGIPLKVGDDNSQGDNQQ